MMTYNPKEEVVTLSDKQLPLYCGREMDDVASILANVAFGELSLQRAYIDMCQIVHEKNNPGKWEGGPR